MIYIIEYRNRINKSEPRVATYVSGQRFIPYEFGNRDIAKAHMKKLIREHSFNQYRIVTITSTRKASPWS